MSVYNGIGRGPPDSHVLNRFSTTYATSYRPYDESRLAIPVRCVPTDISIGVDQSQPNSVSRDPHAKQQSVQPIQTKSTACDATPTGLAYQQKSYFTRLTVPDTSNGSISAEASQFRSLDIHLPSVSLTERQLPFNRCCASDRYSTRANHFSSPLQPTVPSNSAAHVKCTQQVIAAEHLSPCTSSVAVYPGSPSSEVIGTTTAAKHRISTCTSNLANIRDYTVETGRLRPVTTTSAPVPTSSNEKTRLTLNSVSPYTPISFDLGHMYSQIARINSHLYLCSLSAITPARLRQHGITLLVSAMSDPPPPHIRLAVNDFLHVSVEDTESAILRVHFDRVADRIASEHRRGGRTLVHCIAGVSRSSSLVLAYLMRHMHMSLADAYQLVRGVRPCIQPNPGFWRQLLEYEERLHGRRSVRLILPDTYPSNGYSNVVGNRAYPFARRSSLLRTTDYFSKPRADLSHRSILQSVHPLDPSIPPFTGFG